MNRNLTVTPSHCVGESLEEFKGGEEELQHSALGRLGREGQPREKQLRISQMAEEGQGTGFPGAGRGGAFTKDSPQSGCRAGEVPPSASLLPKLHPTEGARDLAHSWIQRERWLFPTQPALQHGWRSLLRPEHLAVKKRGHSKEGQTLTYF